jgi:drug/metabolite transporter (DMT)-like permease
MDCSSFRVRLALVVTVCAWASAFTATRIALTGLSPAQVAVLRYALAALAIGVVARRARVRLPRGGELARVAAVGALGLGVYNVVLGTGQLGVPAGTASVLIATAPIWMALITAAAGAERIGGRAAAGLALGFAGVALVQLGPDGLGGGTGAIALLLGAAALQAIYSLAQRPLVARHGAAAFLVAALGGATLVLLPAAPGAIGALDDAGAAPALAVLYLGLVPGALGLATWAYASNRVSTAVAGATLYAVPPVAMLIAFAAMGEAPTATSIGGGALILVAIALTRSGAKQRVHRVDRLGTVGDRADRDPVVDRLEDPRGPDRAEAAAQLEQLDARVHQRDRHRDPLLRPAHAHRDHLEVARGHRHAVTGRVEPRAGHDEAERTERHPHPMP